MLARRMVPGSNWRGVRRGLEPAQAAGQRIRRVLKVNHPAMARVFCGRGSVQEQGPHQENATLWGEACHFLSSAFTVFNLLVVQPSESMRAAQHAQRAVICR